MKYYLSTHEEIETAGKYLIAKLNGKINKLRWTVINVFICGFGIGAIAGTIIWFAVWGALGQPELMF